jgi:hypothetical protein
LTCSLELPLRTQAAPAGGRFAAVLAAEYRGARVARNSPPAAARPAVPTTRLPSSGMVERGEGEWWDGLGVPALFGHSTRNWLLARQVRESKPQLIDYAQRHGSPVPALARHVSPGADGEKDPELRLPGELGQDAFLEWGRFDLKAARVGVAEAEKHHLRRWARVRVSTHCREPFGLLPTRGGWPRMGLTLRWNWSCGRQMQAVSFRLRIYPQNLSNSCWS